MKTWIHIIIFNIRPFFAPFFDCAFCTHHQTPEAIWKWTKCLAGIYHYLSQADTNWSDRTWDSTTNSYQSQSWEEWNYLVHQEKHSVLILPSSNKTDLHCDVTDATAATPNLLRSRHFFQTNAHTRLAWSPARRIWRIQQGEALMIGVASQTTISKVKNEP